ncbi:MAG: glycosyltransferase [Omnitrophica WOR_2 bacterium]
MNILFIVPYVPNLVRVRPYNLIRSLARRGNNITLATLISEESEVVDIEKLRPHCRQILSMWMPKLHSVFNLCAALPTSRPLQASYSWQPAFARQIARHIDQTTGKQAYDVIHVEHLRGAPYGISLKRSDANPPVVWDSVDCISHLFQQASLKSKKNLSRWGTRFELGRTRKYESWLARQFDAVMVTSSVDRDAFLALPGSENQVRPIRVLPNGVDLDTFKPGNSHRDPATLVVSGKMSYHANITMTLFLVKEVMPLIWSRRPDVRVIVAGKNPSREILALADNPRIQVTGTVQDISSFMQKSTVAVAPIQYGAGIQNKVLEAMATATPVITTAQGISALTVQPGRDLLVAGDAVDFAEKVLFLLNHPEEQLRIGQSGREYVGTHYQWNQVAAQLEEIYQEVNDSEKNVAYRWVKKLSPSITTLE